ncbi:hypothetical protein ACFSQD_09500 [Flavihumibacter stibioxidans]|uniref:hypothetical protein n=1 Tax=Flavihumibacter stibioxidans TaxID=1834163 RepID=UPI00164F25D5|nr:hypothetical protein [Flavihumibacter stibioxidans]
MLRLFSIQLLLLLCSVFSGGSIPLMERRSLDLKLVVKCESQQAPQEAVPAKKSETEPEVLTGSPLGSMVLDIL